MLTWALVGLAVGLSSGILVGGRSVLQATIVGMVGGVIGGWLFVAITGTDVTQPSLANALIALVGAVLFEVLARGITEGRTAV
ncbi:MAG: GlsB/YeaQ/YmgE family stress response membrane protein [Sphingomonadaceae bacterium]